MHEQWIREFKDRLAEPRLYDQDIMTLLYGPNGVPVTTHSVLEGTELDREDFFRSRGSWPSIQVLFNETSASEEKTNPQFWFAHQEYLPDFYPRNANLFHTNGTLITAAHVLRGWLPNLEYLDSNADITGFHVNDVGISDSMQRNLDHVELDWDRRKMQEDLSGQLVHVPLISEKIGTRNPDRTSITSGVAFKITPNFLFDVRRPGRFIFTKPDSENLRDILLQSYACIIQPGDVNDDGEGDKYDLKGISGSPVFTDADCASGTRMPSGVAHRTVSLEDKERNITYTALLFHGPDVIGKIQDEINTLVGMEVDERESPNKKQLTAKVQTVLREYGYRTIAIDGLYGDQTRQVIDDFQRRVFKEEVVESRLIPGTVDRLTWNALFPHEQNPNRTHLWS